MEEKQIAAILMGAAATVFAARIQLAASEGVRIVDIKLGNCAAEVFMAWRDIIKNVNQYRVAEAKES